jgi:hypothetical protein
MSAKLKEMSRHVYLNAKGVKELSPHVMSAFKFQMLGEANGR